METIFFITLHLPSNRRIAFALHNITSIFEYDSETFITLVGSQDEIKVKETFGEVMKIISNCSEIKD